MFVNHRSAYGRLAFTLVTGLGLVAGSALAGATDWVPCCSDSRRAVRPTGEPYAGPLIDAHAHFSSIKKRLPDGAYLDRIVKIVESDLVSTVLFLPTPNAGHNKTFPSRWREAFHILHNKAPGRFGALCGATYTNAWLGQSVRGGEEIGEAQLNRRLVRLVADMASDACLGFGEFALRHYNKYKADDTRGSQPVIVIPFETAAMHRMFEVVARAGKPINLHIEPMTQYADSHEQGWLSEVTGLARRYPDIPLILSHTGMTRPENLRQILEALPNIYADIRIVEPGTGWTNLEAVNRHNGAFYEDWARLFEDMPERFMVGTDYKFFKDRNKGKRREVGGYGDLVKIYRRALGSLRPDAAETIAHKTAKRVFGL